MATMATATEPKPLSPKERSLKDKEVVSPFSTFMTSRQRGFGTGTSSKWGPETGTNFRKPLIFEDGPESTAGDAFSSFLALRPKVKPPPTTREQQLREEVLRTKRQLLQVALQAELEDLGSSAPNEMSRRARKMRRAYKYLRNPERTLEAMSDASSSPRDDEEAPAGAEVTAHDLDAASELKPVASPPLSERGLLQNELQPSARSQRSQRSQGSAKDTKDSEKGQLLGHSMSLPNLSTSQVLGTSCTVSLPPLSDVSRPGATKQDMEPLLTGWYEKTRCWNMSVSKSVKARRQNLGLPGGGVVIGNGRLANFTGSHLLVTGYYYGFQVEAVDEDHFPLKQLKDMSIGLGISRLPARNKACERPMYAYEVPGTVLVGYGGHVIEDGRWKRTTWDPRDLKHHDVVGVLVEPGGDLVVYVNDDQVLRVSTGLNEDQDSIKKRELFPIVDLHGRVSAVNLLPRSAPPNKPLHARNRVF